MRAARCVLVLLGLGCGVPEAPSVPALEARAAEGEAGAVADLLRLVGRDAPIEIRAEAYRALLRVGGRGTSRVLAACRDPDPVRREHALALAANLKIPGTREEAVRALADTAFPRRYVAAWVLGELGAPEGTPHLVAALSDRDAETAKEAARSLTKLGPGVVEPLLGAIPALGVGARSYALRVLGDLRDARAAEVLIAALADPETRADGAWALGRLGTSAPAEPLLAHVGDADWRVRLEVARSLGLLEARSAEPALETLRASDPVPAVREWAARSLALLRGEPQSYRNARGEWVYPESVYR